MMLLGMMLESVESENFTMSDTLEGAVVGQDIVFIAVQTP